MVEIRQVILARSLQMIRSTAGTVGYFPDLVRQIKIRYGFITAPKDEDLLPSDPPKGAEFQHGRLLNRDRLIIIDRLTLWSDGIVADASSSTEDMDRFLEDIGEWAKTAIPKATPIGPRYYLSQIEVKMDNPLEAHAPKFRPIGERIAALLGDYGIQTPRYELSSLNLYFDILGRVNPQPGAFSLDRRQNIPYVENVWFSQAPLKTADHIALLNEFEK